MSAPIGERLRALFSRTLGAYGMLAILLLLAAFFSAATLRPQQANGPRAARKLDRILRAQKPAGAQVVIFARGGADDLAFARGLARRLEAEGTPAAGVVTGEPKEIKELLERLAAATPGGSPKETPGTPAAAAAGAAPPPVVAATLESYAPVLRAILQEIPGLAQAPVLTPPSYRWPTFLLRENLLNVANQIAVIAIVAIGMTMVILTGGIDLSVGSLIALAAVTSAGLIRDWGGEGASTTAMVLSALSAILFCGLFGAVSGLTITRFDVPPFIATLGMMQVASGLAYILSQGRPIYQVPDRFVTLGRSADPLLGIPYAVILMLALFAMAHLIMSRTVFGRRIYAVGGNAEAARLAGVRVKAVLMSVYLFSGMLAGLGGVIMASQLKSGAPTYGLMYELYVIAAVVVGGTSLSGGEGRILGTLIGAFIIAVIQNGMNLTNVESYTQKVVLGLVILMAVLLDRIKRRGWIRPAFRARRGPQEGGAE